MYQCIFPFESIKILLFARLLCFPSFHFEFRKQLEWTGLGKKLLAELTFQWSWGWISS